jgi:hypothetical protein
MNSKFKVTTSGKQTWNSGIVPAQLDTDILSGSVQIRKPVATFTRASDAYMQDGIKKNSGEPRYLPGLGGKQSIFIEEGTTNLVLNSDFETLAPTKQRVFFDDFNRAGQATFTRSGVANNSITGTQVASGIPRYIPGRFQNLLSTNTSNGGEDGTTTDFGFDGGTTVGTSDTTYVWQGSKSIKVVTPAISGYGVRTKVSGAKGLAGVSYICSAYVYSESSANLVIQLQAFDNSLAYISGSPSKSMVIPAATWTRMSDSFTAPTGTAYLSFKVVNGDATARTYWVDGFQIEEKVISSTTPTDWRLGGSGSGIFVEEGTTNLLTANQSSAETDTTGFDRWQPSGIVELVRDTTTSYFGTASMRVKSTVDGTVLVDTGTSRTSITEGSTYTFSVYAKSQAVSGRKWKVILRWHGSDGSIISSNTTTLLDAQSTWTRLQITGTAPTNATLAECQLHLINAISGEYLWWDGAQLEQKEYATSWILGGTTRNAETLTYPTTSMSPTAGTWEQWVYVNSSIKRQITSPTANQPIIFKISGSVTPNGIEIHHRQDSANWLLRTCDDNNTLSDISMTPDSATPDGWHLFSVTWSTSSAKLYIDGTLKGTIINPKLPSSFSNIYIGRDSGSNNFANTYHDAIRASNVVRTDAEILAYYNATSPLSQLDDKTVFLLNFDGDLDAECTVQAGWNSMSSTYSGKWQIKNNKLFSRMPLYNEVNNGWNWHLVHGDAEWKDVDISCKISMQKQVYVSGCLVGITVRSNGGTDSNNYLSIAYSTSQLTVYKRVNGIHSQVASVSYTTSLNTEYQLRIVVTGTSGSVYIAPVGQSLPGTPTLSFTVPSDVPTKGYIAAYSNYAEATFDDIEVKADVPDWWNCRSGGWSRSIDQPDRFGLTALTTGFNELYALKRTSVRGYSDTNKHTDFRTQYIATTIGSTYTLSFFIKGLISGGSGFQVYFQPKDSNGTTLSTDSVLVISPSSITSNWKKYTVTYTVTAQNSTKMFIWFTLTEGVQGWYAVDSIQLEQKSYATSYHRNDSTKISAVRKDEVISVDATHIPNNCPFTLECFAMTSAPNTKHRVLFSAWDKFYLSISPTGPDKILLSWRDDVMQRTAYSSTPVQNVSSWHHYALVWDCTVAKCYVDGIKVIEINTVLPKPFPTTMLIGRLGVTDYINGCMSQVRISDHARTDEEILAYYNEFMV